MELNELRMQIDDIDSKLVDLFVKRMAISAQVAACKKENGMPIYVPAREQEKLHQLSNQAGAGMESYTRELYSTIFRLSRSYQEKCNQDSTPQHQHTVDSF